ncbi:hypothetical protein L2E29_25060, partial [Salmonella enterica subsp. enterica serovar Weltevreden]|nr:hypothetical protein [Salmonella enterica subsp. enterica serovar Weltevreden]
GGYHYFPNLEVLLICIVFVAIEIFAYIVLIRLLPILPPLKNKDHNRHEASKELARELLLIRKPVLRVIYSLTAKLRT